MIMIQKRTIKMKPKHMSRRSNMRSLTLAAMDAAEVDRHNVAVEVTIVTKVMELEVADGEVGAQTVKAVRSVAKITSHQSVPSYTAQEQISMNLLR